MYVWCIYVCMYVCMCVFVCVCVWCSYVGRCVHTYRRMQVCVGLCASMCVCLDGCSKVGINECMLNTSRTHINAKEVRYLLVAFSLKTYFYNISMNTITQEVCCINFPSHIPKSIVSFWTKQLLSQWHPPKVHSKVRCTNMVLPRVCLSPQHVKASLIWSMPSAGIPNLP